MGGGKRWPDLVSQQKESDFMYFGTGTAKELKFWAWTFILPFPVEDKTASVEN